MADDILIREGRLDDIPALVDLLGGLFAAETDLEADPARQQRGLTALMTEAPAARVWVAEAAGRVVGMCQVQRKISTAEGGRIGEIEDVIVDPAWRGRGVGRRLLDTLEAWAAAEGLLRLHLLADRHNTGALGFYERLGWAPADLVCLRKYRFGPERRSTEKTHPAADARRAARREGAPGRDRRGR
ncbi:MAG: N-acetyltransferase family protein [Planctomycetota bacterium]